MSQTDELDCFPGISEFINNLDFDWESIRKRTSKFCYTLVDVCTELQRNGQIVEKLCIEEAQLNEVVQQKCQDISRLKSMVEMLEADVKNILGKIEAKRKDYEAKCNKMQHIVNIERTLGNTMMHILGIRLKLRPIKPFIWEIKFIYQEDASATLLLDVIECEFDLQSIHPPHNAFDKIRSFLLSTGDINGFLWALRDFFAQKND